MRPERVTGLFIVPCMLAGLSILLSGSDRLLQAPAAISAGQVLVDPDLVLPSAAASRPSQKVGSRVRPGAPTALQLPALGVTAPVVPVVSLNHELVPPSDYTTVGWWEDGVAPGAATGTTVIIGHTVHTGGGALDNLGDMHPGDLVIVDRPRHDLAYRVAAVRTYVKASFGLHAGQILSQSGPGRLAIVTCGDYNGEIFLTNIVVIATNPRVIS